MHLCQKCSQQLCDNGVATVFCGNASAGVCIVCYPGRFVNNVSRRCDTCSPGTFQDNSDEPMCKACEPGKRCAESGMASGQTCREGEACQILDDEELRQYKAVLDAKQFKQLKGGKCPDRYHCPDGTVLSPSSRPCEDGEVWDGVSRCSRCERSDQFAVTNSTFVWLAAETNMHRGAGVDQAAAGGTEGVSGNNAGGDAAGAAAGWDAGREACAQCPQILNDEAECHGGTLRFHGGFWHSGLEWRDPSHTILVHRTVSSFANESFTFFPCPCPECCIVGAINGSVVCAGGTAGALCAACAADHFRHAEHGRCVPCTDVSFADGPWMLLLAASCCALLFVWSDARCQWRRMRCLQRHIQGCRRIFATKSKIVWSFLQILMLAETVYRVPFPPEFDAFMRTFAFLRLDLFKLVPLHCFLAYDFHDVLDANTAMAAIMLCPLCVKLVGELRQRGDSRLSRAGSEEERAQEVAPAPAPAPKDTDAETAKAGDREEHPRHGWLGRVRRTSTRDRVGTAAGWSIVAMFVFYPTVSSTFFQAFSCETIVLGSQRTAGAQPRARSRWLHRDYSVDCDSDRHKAYERLAATMIAAFAFGVPALLWGLLYRRRHNLLEASAQYLSFLFGDYRAQYWYWEVVECVRKLVLAGVSLFFSEQGSLLQVSTAIMLLVLYGIVLAKVWPYALPSDNVLAQASNLALLVALFVSMLLKVKSSFVSTGRYGLGYSEAVLGRFLIAVVVIEIVLYFVALVLDVRYFNTQQSFRLDENGNLLVMPKLKRPLLYHAFISHSQQDGGDQVAHIKKELEKYVCTISIFTDVAAGCRERALTRKTDLYGAIDASDVFLVFLTKTYFTRKWCVIEFRDAIAKRKKIVLVMDRDERHGGMRLGIQQFVKYSRGQKDRMREDTALGASNLWNEAEASGDKTLVELAKWVEKHLAYDTNNRLRITKFRHKEGEVPEQSYPVVPWYRFAEEKKVSLQLLAEEMLTTEAWNIPEGQRVLKLPAPRPWLHAPRHLGRHYHLFLSAHHNGSAAIKRKLENYHRGVRVYLPDGDADPKKVE
eukprot:g1142.t1